MLNIINMNKLKSILVITAFLFSGLCYGQHVDASLEALQKIKDAKTLKTKINSLERGSETDLGLLVSYYRAKRDDAKMDAVIALGAHRFPQGELAFQAAINDIENELDASKRKTKFTDTKSKFPNFSKGIEFQKLNARLMVQSLNEPSLDNSLFYLNYIKSPEMFSAMAYFINAKNPSIGEELYRNFVNENMGKAGIESVLAGYSRILLAKGNLAEASKYALQAYPNSKHDREFLEDYVKILNSEGKKDKAVKVLEEMVINGIGSAEIEATLAQAYANSGVDAKAKLMALHTEQKHKYKEELIKDMKNVPSPEFTVKDIHGKDVTLADFKGKTIVLDFWAMWCAPCKASFPTMQKLVDVYKDDQQVKFLFIHTWERGTKTPLEDASKYLKDNNYTFDLLMDYANPQTKVNPTVSSFGVEGIPTKFVIDGNGIILFISDGLNNDESEVVKELSTMIEIAKSNT